MTGLEQVCLSVIPKLKVKGRFVIENRHNTIGSAFFRSNMKEIDDTPLHENESEEDLEVRFGILEALLVSLEHEFAALHQRVANLETQRTPQDENDDPEWY